MPACSHKLDGAVSAPGVSHAVHRQDGKGDPSQPHRGFECGRLQNGAFRNLVGNLRSEGRTILLTTHDMAEAEAVCDRVTLIDKGKIIAVETPRSLSRLIAGNERIDFEGGTEGLDGKLGALPGVASVNPLPDGGSRVDLEGEAAAQSVLKILVDNDVTTISTSRPSLEEIYIRVIGDKGTERAD